MLKDQFSLPSLLCVGALLQTSLLLVLPTRWAILPSAGFALHGIISTTLQIIFPSLNQFNKDIVRGRVSAQLPNSTYKPSSPETSPLFSAKPSSSPIVVFHLGVRYNHPLGMFAPGASQVGKFIFAMFESLEVEAQRYGCLGMSPWRGAERASNNSTMLCFYFRDVEGLHAFAHDKVHREAWDWWNKWVKETGHGHLGIFHEVFRAAPGEWESVYVDMPPTMLGAADVQVKNEETGEEEHVVPLVDADNVLLRSQYGRMGRTKGGDRVDV
jgi:hypothetical protein